MRYKHTFRYGNTPIEKNVYLMIQYHTLRKEETMWRCQGQHWLANHARLRADSLLLNGEDKVARKNTEDLYHA